MIYKLYIKFNDHYNDLYNLVATHKSKGACLEALKCYNNVNDYKIEIENF